MEDELETRQSNVQCQQLAGNQSCRVLTVDVEVSAMGPTNGVALAMAAAAAEAAAAAATAVAAAVAAVLAGLAAVVMGAVVPLFAPVAVEVLSIEALALTRTPRTSWRRTIPSSMSSVDEEQNRGCT